MACDLGIIEKVESIVVDIDTHEILDGIQSYR
jgi:hypothetical protein